MTCAGPAPDLRLTVLLGHASIQTPERYLGTVQNLHSGGERCDPVGYRLNQAVWVRSVPLTSCVIDGSVEFRSSA